MIILAVAGCFLSGTYPQCGVVYDSVNQYQDVQACEMRMDEIADTFKLDALSKKVFCIDYEGKKEDLQHYLNMIGGYHKKADA